MVKLGELVEQLSAVEPMDEYEVVVVQQPNYPLTAEIDRVEFKGHKVFIHLYDASEYYSEEDDDAEGVS